MKSLVGIALLCGFSMVVILSCASEQIEQTVFSKEDTLSTMVEMSAMDKAVDKCPEDMVFVAGDYCSNLEEVCLKWLDPPACQTKDSDGNCSKWSEPLRCAEFKNPTVCHSAKKHMEFCIDKYEFPNKLGEKPSLQNTWYQANNQCQALGKRLCQENEWTQACRGPHDLPYPYGYLRDETVCRIDLPWQDPTTHTFAELDKTLGAGAMPRCISEYGVNDLTGNGDEWAVSNGGTTYISVLKGGHPHGVRNRCTPHTTGHGPTFSFYDTGFRCCKDSK